MTEEKKDNFINKIWQIKIKQIIKDMEDINFYFKKLDK